MGLSASAELLVVPSNDAFSNGYQYLTCLVASVRGLDRLADSDNIQSIHTGEQETQLSVTNCRCICAICNSVDDPLKHAPSHQYVLSCQFWSFNIKEHRHK